jgi:ABC-type transport system involved in multi-copper enzyme maturation permease subunit
MSVSVSSLHDWLRRTLRWSNSLESWQERVGFAAVLAMVAFNVFIGRGLAPSYQVVLWCLAGVTLAVVLRRGWLRLFGPVLFYDLVRVGRRNRYFLIRTAYGCFMLLMLSYIWLVWSWDTSRRGFRANEAADFASQFFYMFMGVQFVVVTVLTPAYTGSAVADEKERRTLEFLLATDLRNREIVLSKLVSRLANILMLMLVGLPILGFLQFLGGVDPGLVLAGFTATGLTVLSLACLSMFYSVLVRRTRDAIALTYLTSIAYLALSASSLLLLLLPDVASFPAGSPVTVTHLVDWVNAGNIVVAVVKLFSGGQPDLLLPGLLRNYAIFHGGVALICAAWAVLRLRAVFLKETYGKPQQARPGLRFWVRPAIGNHPMVWKEVFAEPRLRWHWLGRVFVLLLVVASFVPVGFILYYLWEDYFVYGRRLRYREPLEELQIFMNVWLRAVGTLAAALTLLGVAVRAAGSISGERDRQTFDSLLTSPLDSTAIFFGKWLGSILSVRAGWLWLGAIGFLGLVTTGLHPLAAPLVLAAWFIYAAFLATLGLWFSMVSRTTLRAILWTLLTTIGLGVGPLVLMMCCGTLWAVTAGPMRGSEDFFRWVMEFVVFSLSPLGTLACLPFCGREFETHGYNRINEGLEMLVCAVIGLGLYLAATVFLWAAANARFRQLTGRTPFRRPERRGPPSRRDGLASRDGQPPSRRRVPLLISEEAPEVHVRPASEHPPPGLRGAILIEEEWRDEEEKPRPE